MDSPRLVYEVIHGFFMPYIKIVHGYTWSVYVHGFHGRYKDCSCIIHSVVIVIIDSTGFLF